MKLQDYLHYYIGCKMIRSSLPQNKPYTLHPEAIWEAVEFGDRPILRRLQDIKDEDLKAMITRLSIVNLDNCEFEYDQYWVNAIRNGVVVDCLSIELNGQIDMMQCTHATNPQLEAFHYLLSEGFDLFGLIDAGLAIDQKTKQ